MVPLCLPGQRRPWQGRMANVLRAQPALESLETRGSPSMLGPTRMLADIAPAALRSVIDLSGPSTALSAGDLNAAQSPRDALATDFWTLDRLAADMQPLATPLVSSLMGAAPLDASHSTGLETRGSSQGPVRLDDTTDPPPVITDFSAGEGTDRWWTFSGHVDAMSPGGMIIQFGGLPTLQNQTVTADHDGNFTFTIQLANCEEGMATAQTTDWNGHVSNVAEDFVHQSNCVIGNTHPV